MDVGSLIREIGRGAQGARSLTVAEAKTLYGAVLDGQVADLELGAILLALRMKSESRAEMNGFMQAISERLPPLRPPPGPLRPVVIPTYNGARRNANLTPFLALALHRLDVPVLLHGLDDAETFGRVSSAQILHAWGEPLCQRVQQAQQRLADQGLAFLSLPAFAPALAGQLAVRRRLGLRNAAHSLVKMLDPFAGAGVLIAAATHPDYLAGMRDVLSSMGQRALLLRASEGEAYANPKRCPTIEYMHERGVDSLCDAEQDSLRTLPCLPANAALTTTIDWMHQVFAGEVPLPWPLAQQLAACLFAAGRADNFAQAARLVAGQFGSLGKSQCVTGGQMTVDTTRQTEQQMDKAFSFARSLGHEERVERDMTRDNLPDDQDMKRLRATVVVEVDERILLVENRAGMLLLPGGGIQEHESCLQAAARELSEETGLVAESLQYLFQHQSATNAHQVFWAAVVGRPTAADDAMALHWLVGDEPRLRERMSDASRVIVDRFRALRQAQPQAFARIVDNAS
ncbi:MAG TPA: DNA-binding protein YbiB [Accumulibacter sp.]|nr:DNA-binding protein YbiB [Accumulibacter sp.]